MRKFLVKRVPVRMGIGRGTFYAFAFAVDVSDSSTVTRSLFAGTAVVYAYAAEKSGGKGIRIFVHPSFEPERHLIKQSVRMLPLPRPNNAGRWGPNYLDETTPAQGQPPANESELKLFEAVKAMEDPKGDVQMRRQYTETFKAMNRMRRESDRKPVNLRRLKSTFRELDSI